LLGVGEHMQFGQVLAFIYSFAVAWVPGLMRTIPPEGLKLAFEAVQAILDNRLKVDFKPNNWMGMVITLKEIAEAISTQSSKERLEAAYWLLALMTDIEVHMTLEEFVKSLGNMPEAEPV